MENVKVEGGSLRVNPEANSAERRCPLKSRESLSECAEENLN
jgi:hypothetical protein